jgi:hypothetical protein
MPGCVEHRARASDEVERGSRQTMLRGGIEQSNRMAAEASRGDCIFDACSISWLLVGNGHEMAVEKSSRIRG